MPRLPHAAHTLVGNVRALRPKAKVEATPYGEVDGFGVYRSIVFNKAVAKWLTPILSAVDDPRIVAAGINDKGLLEVIFSHRTIADDRSPFSLAESVVSGD